MQKALLDLQKVTELATHKKCWRINKKRLKCEKLKTFKNVIKTFVMCQSQPHGLQRKYDVTILC